MAILSKKYDITFPLDADQASNIDEMFLDLYRQLGTSLLGGETPSLAALDKGSVIITNATGNLVGLEPVATGQVIISQGVDKAPVWSTSPTITGGFTLNGNLLFTTDATYNIGNTATNRPNSLNLSNRLTSNTVVVSPSTTGYVWFANPDRTLIRSPVDGQLTFLNTAETDFTRVNFGGITSAFVALKRSGTILQSRLGDDTDFGSFEGLTPVTAYAVDGAITIAPRIAKITKGSAAALTLADPSAAQEGTQMIITAQTAFAHTVDNSAGSGFNAGGAASDIATFGGAIGDTFHIAAINTKWNVISLRNVTLA